MAVKRAATDSSPPALDPAPPVAQGRTPHRVWMQSLALRARLRVDETGAQRRRIEAEAARHAAERQVPEAIRGTRQQACALVRLKLRAADELKAKSLPPAVAVEALRLRAKANAELRQAREGAGGALPLPRRRQTSLKPLTHRMPPRAGARHSDNGDSGPRPHERAACIRPPSMRGGAYGAGPRR